MPLPSWYVNAKDIGADLWAMAGTKIIGYGSFAIGLLGTMDAGTTQMVMNALGPRFGNMFSFLCLAAAGILVAKRGHRNTGDIAQAVLEKKVQLSEKPPLSK